jgi:hypothetical protein
MHPALTVASQPFPVLYLMAMERFHHSLGIVRRYPLDHCFLEDAYSADELVSFLERDVYDEDAVTDLVVRLGEYSHGLWTPQILDLLEGLRPGTFYDLYHQLNERIARLFPNENCAWLGGKEVLTEELAGPLGRIGTRTVFVVRDPRAMITSLNFRQRDNLTGNLRPVLYSIRAWRKSVAFGIEAQKSGSALMIRYEDLVTDHRATLARVTDFLNVGPYADSAFAEGIVDQHGATWAGNSSFVDQRGISEASLANYREHLPSSVQTFIEALSEPEMRLLGYGVESDAATLRDAIEGYRDPFENVHEKFSPEYSSDPSRIQAERHRLDALGSGLGPAERRRWFITDAAYDALVSRQIFFER